MDAINSWDVALLAAASYIAVVSLVRLMNSHRDQLAAQLRAEMEAEQQRLKQIERSRKKKEAAKLARAGRVKAA
jgi:hypothetical protein